MAKHNIFKISLFLASFFIIAFSVYADGICSAASSLNLLGENSGWEIGKCHDAECVCAGCSSAAECKSACETEFSSSFTENTAILSYRINADKDNELKCRGTVSGAGEYTVGDYKISLLSSGSEATYSEDSSLFTTQGSAVFLRLSDSFKVTCSETCAFKTTYSSTIQAAETGIHDDVEGASNVGFGNIVYSHGKLKIEDSFQNHFESYSSCIIAYFDYNNKIIDVFMERGCSASVTGNLFTLNGINYKSDENKDIIPSAADSGTPVNTGFTVNVQALPVGITPLEDGSFEITHRGRTFRIFPPVDATKVGGGSGSCSDSDTHDIYTSADTSGKNKFVFGITTGVLSPSMSIYPELFYDFCIEGENAVNEYYCHSTNPLWVVSEGIPCTLTPGLLKPTYCVYGACLTKEKIICIDSDKGSDLYSYGETYMEHDEGYKSRISDSCAVLEESSSYEKESECSGDRCYVAEAVCAESSNYGISYNTPSTSYYKCNSCLNGVCLDQQYIYIFDGDELSETPDNTEDLAGKPLSIAYPEVSKKIVAAGSYNGGVYLIDIDGEVLVYNKDGKFKESKKLIPDLFNISERQDIINSLGTVDSFYWNDIARYAAFGEDIYHLEEKHKAIGKTTIKSYLENSGFGVNLPSSIDAVGGINTLYLFVSDSGKNTKKLYSRNNIWFEEEIDKSSSLYGIDALFEFNGKLYAITDKKDIIEKNSIEIKKFENVDESKLESMQCGGGTANGVHYACRASRFCRNAGYDTGFQIEWEKEVGGSNTVFCIKGGGVDEFTKVKNEKLASAEASCSSYTENTYNYLMCRATEFCKGKGYKTGFQTEWNNEKGHDFYCLTGDSLGLIDMTQTSQYKKVIKILENNQQSFEVCEEEAFSGSKSACTVSKLCSFLDYTSGFPVSWKGSDFSNAFCIAPTSCREGSYKCQDIDGKEYSMKCDTDGNWAIPLKECENGCDDSTGQCSLSDCNKCGVGIFNICDKDECNNIAPYCEFEPGLLIGGSCREKEMVCKDTDGGKNYEQKGSVSKCIGSESCTIPLYDYCDGNELVEYYCTSDVDVGKESKTCETSCSDGACSSNDNNNNGVRSNIGAGSGSTGETGSGSRSAAGSGSAGTGTGYGCFYKEGWIAKENDPGCSRSAEGWDNCCSEKCSPGYVGPRYNCEPHWNEYYDTYVDFKFCFLGKYDSEGNIEKGEYCPYGCENGECIDPASKVPHDLRCITDKNICQDVNTECYKRGGVICNGGLDPGCTTGGFLEADGVEPRCCLGDCFYGLVASPTECSIDYNCRYNPYGKKCGPEGHCIECLNDADCTSASLCGNGFLDKNEECDPGVLNSDGTRSHRVFKDGQEDCRDFLFDYGSLKCTDDCRIDKSECTSDRISEKPLVCIRGTCQNPDSKCAQAGYFIVEASWLACSTGGFEPEYKGYEPLCCSGVWFHGFPETPEMWECESDSDCYRDGRQINSHGRYCVDVNHPGKGIKKYCMPCRTDNDCQQYSNTCGNGKYEKGSYYSKDQSTWEECGINY